MFKDKTWGTLVLIFASIPFWINFFVDGNNIFGINIVPSKPYFQNEVFFKLQHVLNHNFENVIMGSSAAGSLDPYVLEKYGFPKDKTYNLGISDSSIYDVWKMFEIIANKTQVKTVFLGINFLAFNPSRITKEKKRNYNFNYFKIYIKNIFSTEAFLITKETIDANRGKGRTTYMDFDRGQYVLGYPHPLDPIRPSYQDFIKILIKETMEDPVYLGDDTLKDFTMFKHPLVYLDKILTLAKQKHIKVYMFAPLVHFLISELIYTQGFEDSFERWLQALAQRGDFYCFLCSPTLRNNDNYFIDFVHLHPHTSVDIFKIMFENDPLRSEVLLTKENIQSKLPRIRERTKKDLHYLNDFFKNKEVGKGFLPDLQ